jgi:predicted TIM-barrel fold metal-dependent hydrolase
MLTSDMTSILGKAHSPPRYRPPAGACDCHTHVFGPANRYPYAASRTYTPPDASIADLTRLQAHLGFDRVVIVHPSPYANDNRVSVDAIAAFGPARARGVAVIDSSISDIALKALDAGGMRGARENVETAGVIDPAAAWSRIEATARRIEPLGWHLQIFTRLTVIEALEAKLATLPVPVVIDHFGRADAALGPEQSGFDALRRLIGSGKAYVKLSASYRISTLADHADAASLARALCAENPDRLVWGTDWPHPGGGGARDPLHRNGIEPFQPIDDGAALDRLETWAEGDGAVLRKILVENPARLYGF